MLFPKIDYQTVYNSLSETERVYLPYIFHKTGELRKSKVKSKPLIKNGKRTTKLGTVVTVWTYASEEDRIKTQAGFIWRNIAFATVNRHPYNCLPVMAGFHLADMSEETEKLNPIIDKILAFIPNQPTIYRWKQALGL